MWHLRRPSDDAIARSLARQADAPYTYAAVGATRDAEAVPGYDHDHNRVCPGHGPAAFAAAREALRRWRHFPPGWTRVFPATPPEPGQAVAMLARALGVWWLNACRVVYVVDETGPICRYGFAYGTLPDHVEQGEERFGVEMGPDGSVWYDLRAFSRPRYWMTRLGYPLARRLQRRFARDSLEAMRRAVAEGGRTL